MLTQRRLLRDDVQEEITSSVEEDTTPAETETETEQVTEPVSEETTPQETTPQETTPQETTASHKTYIVQDGDTLYGIIKREYGSEDPQKLQELFDLNGITDGGNSIAPGDELILP